MSGLSPRQMFLLDEACKALVEGFGETPYLVGTALNASAGVRGDFRDVDVRIMMPTDKFTALQASGQHVPELLGIVIGQYLAQVTGLPIDFQIQRADVANELHPKTRNPLGLRSLNNYRGDAYPKEDS